MHVEKSKNFLRACLNVLSLLHSFSFPMFRCINEQMYVLCVSALFTGQVKWTVLQRKATSKTFRNSTDVKPNETYSEHGKQPDSMDMFRLPPDPLSCKCSTKSPSLLWVKSAFQTDDKI